MCPQPRESAAEQTSCANKKIARKYERLERAPDLAQDRLNVVQRDRQRLNLFLLLEPILSRRLEVLMEGFLEPRETLQHSVRASAHDRPHPQTALPAAL